MAGGFPSGIDPSGAQAPRGGVPAQAAHPQWDDAKIRGILRGAGYNVATTGGYTARAHAAWNHYLAQTRSGVKAQAAAHDWNKTALGRSYKSDIHAPTGALGPVGTPGKPVVHPPTGALGPAGGKYGPIKGSKPAPKQHKGGSGKGDVNLGALQSIATKVGVLQPNSLADTLAGLQYDTPIHQAKLDLATGDAQHGQNMKDIADWYAQVMGAQKTAGTEDHAATSGAVDSVKNAVASIVSSLGGGANQGAGLVGASGADSVGLLSALGLNQDHYNNELAPLLEADKSGASQRQLALDSQTKQKTQASLSDLLGQRGQSVAKNLMDIQTQNAQTQQQRFQNKLALEQANEAALMSGLNVIQANQKIQANGAALKQGKLSGWLALDNPSRENYVNHALQQAITLHTHGNATDWSAVGNTARDILRKSYGYASARKPGFGGKVPSPKAQLSINSFLNRAIALAQAKQH